MIAFTCGVGGSLLLARHTVPFPHMLSILFTLGVSITGVMTVARWAFHQLKTNADVGSQSESASLLLQEYEQRGVGWLWQVDGENRVTYISSRMSALLGRPAGQLEQPPVWNLAMHYGTGALLGTLRGLWAAVGLRGLRANAAHTALRLAFDQTLENITGCGAPPHTWPVEEQVWDVAHKAVFSFSTGVFADLLVPTQVQSRAGRVSH